MKPRSFKEALGSVLTKKEMEKTVTSFDVIGDIAILEVPERLERRKKAIANALLKVHKNIKVVLRKASGRGGPYRTHKLHFLAGAKRVTTVHHESSCTFALNVETCYFSMREATERQRIASLVKDGERVLVMFAGVGPYAIVIAKKKDVQMVAVEINPDAVAYMEKNVKANKVMHRVAPVLGDVKMVVPDFDKFDRVVMPLPLSAHEYLDVAIHALKKGGIVHFYSVQQEKDLYSEPMKVLEHEAKKMRRRVKIVDKRAVLPYAPRVWKVCVDAKIF